MDASLPILLISGLVDASQVDRLRAVTASSSIHADVRFAQSPPRLAGEHAEELLDLTSILDEEAFVAACREATSGPRARVLVRDHQLGFTRMLEALNQYELQSTVLYSAISYDTDPAWALGALTDLSALTQVEFFALDLFCDVEDSWDFFAHRTREDEFEPVDLQRLCERFPVLLTVDLRADNAREVMSFPGVKGLLLACDALAPRVPAERHVLSLEDITSILALGAGEPSAP
jgi:hypothetical protein